jgi:hypothetical protein
MSHFEGHFEGAKTFRDNLGVKKDKVIVPQKKLCPKVS